MEWHIKIDDDYVEASNKSQYVDLLLRVPPITRIDQLIFQSVYREVMKVCLKMILWKKDLFTLYCLIDFSKDI